MSYALRLFVRYVDACFTLWDRALASDKAVEFMGSADGIEYWTAVFLWGLTDDGSPELKPLEDS